MAISFLPRDLLNMLNADYICFDLRESSKYVTRHIARAHNIENNIEASILDVFENFGIPEDNIIILYGEKNHCIGDIHQIYLFLNMTYPKFIIYVLDDKFDEFFLEYPYACTNNDLNLHFDDILFPTHVRDFYF